MRDEIQVALDEAHRLVCGGKGIHCTQDAVALLIKVIQGLKAKVDEHEDVILKSRLRCVQAEAVECSDCEGKGRFEYLGMTVECSFCKGTGKERQ